MAECFDLELKDGIAHLRLCRPEAMNTMTPAFWRELPALANQLSDEGEARVIVLSSTGKHFTAGMDLAVFQRAGGSSDAIQAGVAVAQGSSIQSQINFTRSNEYEADRIGIGPLLIGSK